MFVAEPAVASVVPVSLLVSMVRRVLHGEPWIVALSTSVRLRTVLPLPAADAPVGAVEE